VSKSGPAARREVSAGKPLTLEPTRSETMSSTVLYMSMSLDGFIAGPNERVDNGLGDGGERLHEWIFPGAEGGDFKAAVARLRGVNRQIYDEGMSTGAVVAGRGTFEPAGGWGGDHHDGVPIYILSRHPAPDWAADWPLVHYVSDLEAAMRDAKHAAGDKNVLVHGAGITQRAVAAGLLDELEIHLVPVLFGNGRRLFEHLGIEQRELERIRVLEGEGGVTHLRYRVRR
jgi:dihydrofolate reductase